RLAPAARAATDGDHAALRHLEARDRKATGAGAAVDVHEDERSLQRLGIGAVGVDAVARRDVVARERLDDEYIAAVEIVPALHVCQNFLPRGRNVLVGSKNCDQRTEVQLSYYHKVPADGIEEEWCQLVK